jgi:hypothetical protein
VSEVPFGGAGIGHALQAEVFRFQALDQGFTGLADLAQPGKQG